MGKKVKVKKSNKTKTTVIMLAVIAPLLTGVLALLCAKLILSGKLVPGKLITLGFSEGELTYKE